MKQPDPAKGVSRCALVMFLFLIPGCGDDDGGQSNGDADGAGDGDGDGDGSDGDDDDDDEEDTGGGGFCNPGIGECAVGQKCQPYLGHPDSCCVDDAMCVPLGGDQKAGETCIRERFGDTCEKEAFCLVGMSSVDVGEGVCIQMCDRENPRSCGSHGMPDATCVAYYDGLLPMCEPMCHPLRPNCEATEGCYSSGFEEHGYLCTAPAHEEGGGNDGDECNSVNGCIPGLQCWDEYDLDGCEHESCCTPDCDLTGDGSECPTETESCVPVFDPANLPHPMYDDVGVCGLAD